VSAERAAGAKAKSAPEGNAPAAPRSAPTGANPVRRHPWLDPRIAVPVGLAILAVQLPFIHGALRGAAAVAAAVPYQDKFDRATVGDAWWSNGGLWRIVDGQLYSPGVGNNPLWLKARLPPDVRVEFDVRSEGPDGDIKWEMYGDGRNHSTGYVFLFGAWRNRESRIVKLDEHALTQDELRAQLAAVVRPYPRQMNLIETLEAPFTRWSARRDLERIEKGEYWRRDTPFVVKRGDLKVERGRTYHVAVTKQGGRIRWEIDEQIALEMTDLAPLSGAGNDRFGFSSWANDTYFDNLSIRSLESGQLQFP
jgi:hypothetical protein